MDLRVKPEDDENQTKTHLQEPNFNRTALGRIRINVNKNN
jgi:hypothetical protein